MKSGKSGGCIHCGGEKKRVIPEVYRWVERRYTAIKHRCENKNDRQYHRYGGRGIACNFNSAIEFLEYVLTLPNFSQDLEIDRTNNDGNYEVGNLRFVTGDINKRNTSSNVNIIFNGNQMCVSDFADNHTKLSRNRVSVLLKRGWTPEEIAVYEPLNRGRRAQSLRLAKLWAEE